MMIHMYENVSQSKTYLFYVDQRVLKKRREKKGRRNGRKGVKLKARGKYPWH